MEPDVEREAADVEHDGQDFIRCSPLEQLMNPMENGTTPSTPISPGVSPKR